MMAWTKNGHGGFLRPQGTKLARAELEIEQIIVE
jgi:hypothetical protein